MHVDDFLKKVNGSTILDIWNGNQTIHNVTIYQLLHMSSGIGDYNDIAMENWTWNHPDGDISPLDYVWECNKTFLCQPGDCMFYSSIGFELLGFVLAQHANVSTWQEFD